MAKMARTYFDDTIREPWKRYEGTWMYYIARRHGPDDDGHNIYIINFLNRVVPGSNDSEWPVFELIWTQSDKKESETYYSHETLVCSYFFFSRVRPTEQMLHNAVTAVFERELKL
jgi:hypothetical protein